MKTMQTMQTMQKMQTMQTMQTLQTLQTIWVPIVISPIAYGLFYSTFLANPHMASKVFSGSSAYPI